MFDLIVRSATVVDPEKRTQRVADVALENGRIALVEPVISAAAREELPADRNSIRITDEEARVTYYACMLPNLSPKQRPLYEKLRERRLI